MDHRDRIGSPTVARMRLVEQRMEMISLLINRMNEGGNKGKELEAGSKRKTRGNMAAYHIWLGRFVLMIQHMFL
jgi:hypothetical protein